MFTLIIPFLSERFKTIPQQSENLAQLNPVNNQLKNDNFQLQAVDSMWHQQVLAFEKIYDSLMITDLEGKIIDWSSSSEKLFGYSKTEVLGKIPDFFQTSEKPEILIQSIINSLNDQERWTGEFNFIRKDGTQGICETFFVPLHNGLGERVAALAINNNITQRKQTEAELREALRQEKEINCLRSRFFSMMSHEFRIPLTIILMSSDLIKSFEAKLSREKKLLHLNQIQAAVRKMNQLLEEVLFLGKWEAGYAEFNPLPIDLEEFCQELLAEIEIISQQKHQFIFSCQTAADLEKDCRFAVDKSLLQKVLSNLLSNAVKYSPQGGTIQFSLTFQALQAVIQITDEGIGIPLSDQKCLFESFNRGSNVGDIPGTGLGLSIIKNAVELHGGTIAFESQVGVGTTFTICLPRLPCLTS
jgi:PAS domain S-box-containing protein